MIVKNEERFLPECLQRLQPYVDEIVVVDTGSTDGTIQIARDYGAKVIEHPWRDDFAEARNVSLAHATGDWILVVDADEHLVQEDGPRLRKAVDHPVADAYVYDIISFAGDDDLEVITKRLGLFKSRPDFRFRGQIHEQINYAVRDAKVPVAHLRVRFEHYGYDPAVRLERNKSERNLNLVCKCLQEDPENAFMHFNCAQELFVLGRAEEAVDHYQTALRLAGTDSAAPYVPITVYRLAYLLFQLRRWAEMYDLLERHLILFPDYTDLRFLYGMLRAGCGDYAGALGTFHQCVAFGDAPPKYENIRPGLGGYKAWREIGRMLETLGNHKQAFAAYGQALDLKPDDVLALKAIMRLLVRFENPDVAVEYARNHAEMRTIDHVEVVWEALLNGRALDAALQVVEGARNRLGEREADLRKLALLEATAFLAAHRFEEALESFRRSAGDQPLPLDGALAMIMMKDLDGAERAVRTGRIDAPLGMLRILQDLVRLLRFGVASQGPIASAYIEHGWQLAARLVFFRAGEVVQKLLDLIRSYGEPGAEVNLRFGKLLWHAGVEDQAVEPLVSAASDGRYDAESLRVLAKVCQDRGLHEDEVVFLDKAVDQSPEDPLLWAWKVDAQLRIGDHAGAARTLERGLSRHPYAFALIRQKQQLAAGDTGVPAPSLRTGESG